MKNDFSNISEDKVKEFYITISQRVKHFRKIKNITQLDLALDIGIKSVAFYSNCENNKYGKHFNLEHLYKISNILEMDISEFFKNID